MQGTTARYSHSIALSLFALVTPQAVVANTASALFETVNPFVYQIRVVDIGSRDKFAIGSGFKVDNDATLATNFHVVAALIHEPGKYRLEIVTHDDNTLTGRIHAIDVVHDLALIRADLPRGGFLELNERALAQGERIYSMGNPQDLGMSIVEGTYNGPVRTTRYEKLLFSGSLNPGMSGGPAFDAERSVVGVNVSTGGEQLSFLVPAAKLKHLLDNTWARVGQSDHKKTIARALRDDQEAFYSTLLNSEWHQQPLGELLLPHELSPSMKCWGHSSEEEDEKYQSSHQHCHSEDEIFLHPDFYTGQFYYDYEWMTTTKLNSFQFYRAVEERFNHRALRNVNDEDYVSDYVCHTNFVAIEQRSWKASSCFRSYKDYKELYDAFILLASVSDEHRAAVIKMGASGISKRLAVGMFKKLLTHIKWTH